MIEITAIFMPLRVAEEKLNRVGRKFPLRVNPRFNLEINTRASRITAPGVAPG